MCRCKAVVTMCRANFRHHPWATSGSGSGFPPYEVLVRKRRPMVSEKLGLGGWAHPDSVLQVCHVRDNPVEESRVVLPSPQKVKDSRHYRCQVERRFRAVGTQKWCPLKFEYCILLSWFANDRPILFGLWRRISKANFGAGNELLVMEAVRAFECRVGVHSAKPSHCSCQGRLHNSALSHTHSIVAATE